MHDRNIAEKVWLLGVLLAASAAAACGGGGGGGSGGPAGVVRGVVVAQADVAARDPQAVGALPEAFAGTAAGRAALAHADWRIGDGGPRGVTAADGSFQIGGLAPGRHRLELSRTLAGDLVRAELPFSVGDDGGATVVAEIAWGVTRATSRFVRDGRTVEETFAPGDVHVTIEDGKIVELGDGTRVWQDVDRDGDFDSCTVVREAATCVVVEIRALQVALPERLRVGERGHAWAGLSLSDGSLLDVTLLAGWESSRPEVATVDSFGSLDSRAPGTTEVHARLGDLASDVATVEVAERGAVQRIHVQNASCYYPLGLAGREEPSLDAGPPPPRADGGISAPVCRQVVLVGETLQFVALAELADGWVDDVTDEVAWTVSPAELGTIDRGRFTGGAPGTGQLVARLGDVASEPSEVTVVLEPTLLAIFVYPTDGGVGLPVAGEAPAGDSLLPCVGCGGFSLTVLRGDDVPLAATGEYDTGIWRDLTAEVAWSSSAPDVASVGQDGLLLAHTAGETQVTASLGEVRSDPGHVRVVEDASVELVWVDDRGERVLGRGDERRLTATASYDVGFTRDVTDEATWHTSDASVARFTAPGVLVGVAAGDVEAWAELGGRRSDPVRLEVYETSELDYCDPANPNRGTWSDGFNHVVLESDCATYAQPGVAALRFTVTESASPGGIFDPCLDLYVYDGDRRVRTIREEGCGDPFLPSGAPGLDAEILKYQLRAFWDLKDDAGVPVAPGTYQIHGRFYLYYDPVVSLTVSVE